jgi:hypothetical protein
MLKSRFLPCLLALAAAVAAAVPARAGEDTAAQLRDELGAMRLQLAERGLFADLATGAAPMTVELPADRRVDLGLVVDNTDAAHARDGLHVLAVSPGSLGARMGIRAGDVLTRINAQPLADLGADSDGRAAAAARLREVLDTLPDGGSMALDVDRGGRALALQAPVERVALPAMRVELSASADPAPADGSTCARISTFDVAPRNQRIYPAALLLIDGRNAGVSGQQNYRVTPGHHVLTVAERIDRRQLPSTLAARVGRSYGASTKTLEIDVSAGQIYHLGAQLRVERLSDAGPGESWWEPVIWLTAPSRCP